MNTVKILNIAQRNASASGVDFLIKHTGPYV